MGILYEKDQGGAATRYVRANGMLLAKITVSGAIHYYLGDHLSAPRSRSRIPPETSFLRELRALRDAIRRDGQHDQLRSTGKKGVPW